MTVVKTSSIKNENPNEKCAKCDAPFVCNTQNIAECHCSQIYLASEVLKYISSKWDGCLCNKCLKEANSSVDVTAQPTKFKD